jgi:hypothetical protein
MLILLLAILLDPQIATAQASALQIRVLSGEDAVNVIQQKTAVAPLIEVRDRNGLPIAGVAVTFSIQGANVASFPGAVSTLTAVTNAAGQATVAAVNPVAAGSFSIQVQAAFQGQTALATIAQSNVLTLAEAAAAGSAATGAGSAASTAGSGASTAGTAAGAGAAGGGGLSVATIGVVGAAAVGGGALVATQVAGADNATTATAPPTPTQRTLTGLIDANLVHNFMPATGPNCTINHLLRADVTLLLTVQNNSSVSGFFRWTGTDTQSAGTCTLAASSSGPFTGNFDISGTAAAITFRNVSNTSTQTLSGAPSSVETIATFNGVFDGTTVTGTLQYERTIVTPSLSQRTNGKVDIPITLR